MTSPGCLRFISGITIAFALLHGCSTEVKNPNVILLTLDTLRADALSCYGNDTCETPVLDRLALEGALFEDAVCQIPATLTSHSAILTGKLPKTTGVRFRSGRLPDDEVTLAEIVSNAGYDTAAFVSSLVLDSGFGLEQGFDRYELGTMKKNGIQVSAERRAEETIDEAIGFVRQERKKPFFAWVHLYDAHTPYDAPGQYKTMYDSNYRGSVNGSVAQITRLTALHGLGLTDRDLQHLRALYYGEVSYLDAQIGRLVSELEDQGILEDTIIIAIADHGESLGEKGKFFHGDDLYQPSMHIPFIIRFPARIDQGARIKQLVQSIDLFPTLLEILQLDTTLPVDGRSLLPLIENDAKKQSEVEERPGFLESEADPVVASNKLYGLRTEEHKFIYNSAHRRTETPVGLFEEIPLKGPAIILARIKSDAPVRLMAHVRYRTRELYTSRDFDALSRLNSTAIYAETVGSDPLHREARQHESFLETPTGWTLQMTPDLYRIATEYGETRGWDTEWMVVEGVGIDVGLPYKQTSAIFWVDQFELYAPSLRFPDSPRYRNPFWIIENFEGNPPRGLADSGKGAPHSIKTAWVSEELFGGLRQQQVEISFSDTIPPNQLDEFYDLKEDPEEEVNLLTFTLQPENERNEQVEMANQSRALLDPWIESDGSPMNVMQMSSSMREAMESLGYTQ